MAVLQAKSVLIWTLVSIQFIAPTSSAPLSADVDSAASNTANAQYSIMIDAGSSGSRLNVYKFIVNDDVLEVSEVQQVKVSSKNVKPGIASFADNPSEIGAYIQPLLNSARDNIPAEKQSSTPIFLMGTAGMRLLSEEDANAVMSEVRSVFSDKEKCPFYFEPEYAQIITGQWEGIYAWITANFLEGVFISKKESNSYGILDLGGASHQNAFKNDENIHQVTLTLGGREFHVFSRSYLGYGLDQALGRLMNFLVEGKNCSESQGCKVKSPCHFRGYEESKNINGMDWKFVGTAQVKKCRSIIKKVFFCKNDSPECPFHDQPSLKGRFLGESGMYYVTYGIGMLETSDKVSAQELGKTSKTYCKQPYDDVKIDPYAKTNCFGANYIYELLTDGYNLPAKKKVSMLKTLNGFDLGWTLGAVLYNAKLL